jgi:hypothetical protein
MQDWAACSWSSGWAGSREMIEPLVKDELEEIRDTARRTLDGFEEDE